MTITAPVPTHTPRMRIDDPVATAFDLAYERLVDARLEYETLRTRGATTGALVAARGSLHRARADMSAARRALAIR